MKTATGHQLLLDLLPICLNPPTPESGANLDGYRLAIGILDCPTLEGLQPVSLASHPPGISAAILLPPHQDSRIDPRIFRLQIPRSPGSGALTCPMPALSGTDPYRTLLEG